MSTHPTNTVLLSGLDALTTEDAVIEWQYLHLYVIILHYLSGAQHIRTLDQAATEVGQGGKGLFDFDVSRSLLRWDE